MCVLESLADPLGGLMHMLCVWWCRENARPGAMPDGDIRLRVLHRFAVDRERVTVIRFATNSSGRFGGRGGRNVLG